MTHVNHQNNLFASLVDLCKITEEGRVKMLNACINSHKWYSYISVILLFCGHVCEGITEVEVAWNE